MTQDDAAIAAALAAPFDPALVKLKPQVVQGDRALALKYVDARVIQDRLDDVLGVMGWQDSYEVLPDGSVVCRLRIRLGAEWITKEDVGGQSEQPDEGDRRKAAFSDALKRAAVKFGIGRYLYREKAQWLPYDAKKRQFVLPPRPAAGAAPTAQPTPPRKPAPTATAAPTVVSSNHVVSSNQAAPQRPYDADQDEAEVIAADQLEYLRWLLGSRGFAPGKLCQRLGVESLAQLITRDYRFAVDELQKLPVKQQGAA